jgi:hypothetical protein
MRRGGGEEEEEEERRLQMRAHKGLIYIYTRLCKRAWVYAIVNCACAFELVCLCGQREDMCRLARSNVVDENFLSIEPFAAHLAHVGLLPCVSAHVCSQVALVRKCPVAHLAVVRLSPRVDAHVPDQIFFVCKPLIAHLARKRFLPRMCAHVSGHLARMLIALTAARADHCVFAGVITCVLQTYSKRKMNACAGAGSSQ